jgi:hypothetical protein
VPVSLDGVTATLTGRAGTVFDQGSISHAELRVSGPQVGTARLALPPPGGAPAVLPTSLTGDQLRQPLCLVRFAGATEPTVLVGFFTGGAHCCFVVRSFSRSGGHWPSLDRDIGEVPPEVEQVDGTPAVVTADSAFAYRFTDYAGSGLPVEILVVRDGRFADVTRQHPGAVRADAARWWAAYGSEPANPLGALAAWTADECLVGHEASAFATLSSLAHQGRLVAALTGPGDGAGSATSTTAGSWPSGEAYVRDLRTFLTQHQYCAPAR